jgi:hypothetical protein
MNINSITDRLGIGDKDIINALDIGVIDDGKTDCSVIINGFLNNEENRGKILYVPKGEYFSQGIVIDVRFGTKLACETDVVFYGDGSEDTFGIKVIGLI